MQIGARNILFSLFLSQPNEVKHFHKANFWHKHATKIRHTILEMAAAGSGRAGHNWPTYLGD